MTRTTWALIFGIGFGLWIGIIIGAQWNMSERKATYQAVEEYLNERYVELEEREYFVANTMAILCEADFQGDVKRACEIENPLVVEKER